MKLSKEIKEKIKQEYEAFKDKQYGNKTIEERKSLDAFFTPYQLSIKMIEALDCDSLEGKTILDPCCGSGNLIQACIIAGANPEKCFGTDIDYNILELAKERVDGAVFMPLNALNVKNIDADIIISNPPYKIGSKITANLIKNTNFEYFINLMPISKYYSYKLYKHIKSLEVVDNKLFDNAIITDNLCISKLTKKTNDFTLDDVILMSYNKEYKDFYKPNRAKSSPFTLKHGEKVENRDKYDINNAFMVTWYVCNGHKAHKVDGDSFDVHYNLRKDITNKDIPDDKCGSLSVTIIDFKTEKEKNNFCRWWYYNPLCYYLINGLNKNGGTPADAIPKIDFSLDLDYEKLNIEDIMNLLNG